MRQREFCYEGICITGIAVVLKGRVSEEILLYGTYIRGNFVMRNVCQRDCC